MVTRSVTGRVTQPTARRVTGDGVSAGSGASLLLDTYTGAVAAFSFRLLRTAYTGNCIRVRRSSDNAEQDIGFIAGVLDSVSLLAFCGAGDGFVVTWYDQSGNDVSVTEATANNQPLIVDAGSLITQNSKTSIYFGGSEALRGTGVNSSQPNTYAVVAAKEANTGADSLIDGITGRNLLAASGLSLQLFSGTSIADGTIPLGELSTFFALFSGADSFGAINGTTQVSGNAGTNALEGITIGNDFNGGNTWAGWISEAVLWGTNRSSNQSAIERDQATAHGITL